MNNSEYIVMSVAAADVDAANVLAAQMDYEPESLGAFFAGYGSDDTVEFYIAGIDIRPWVREAIQVAEDKPDSLVLHLDTTVEDVANELGVVPCGSM